MVFLPCKSLGVSWICLKILKLKLLALFLKNNSTGFFQYAKLNILFLAYS